MHNMFTISLLLLIVAPNSDYIRINRDLQCLPGSNIYQVIDTIYPNLSKTTASDAVHLAQHAILTTTNNCVDRINAIATDLFPGEARVYFSADSISATSDDGRHDLPVDYLNTLNPTGTVSSFPSLSTYSSFFY